MHGYTPAPVGTIITPGDMCYNLALGMYEPANLSIGRVVREENRNRVIRPTTSPNTYPITYPEIQREIRVRNFLSLRKNVELDPVAAERVYMVSQDGGPVFSDNYPSEFIRYFRKAA